MSDILIYGEVGIEPSAKQVVDQLAKIDSDVTVHINSPGGDVYEGVAIMNALRSHPGEVTVIIEGLAASAASYIAVGGGDRVVARPQAEMMIHEAWSIGQGNATELSKLITDLDRQSASIATIYADKAGGEEDMWRDLMREETWFSADEALEAGLIDAVEDARQPVARRSFAKAMSTFRYAGRAAAPPPSELMKPSFGQEGDTLNINKLAQELGVDSEALRDKLSGFFNEKIEVSGTVDVSYPDDVTVAPTERVEVSPVIEGDVTADGLSFAVTESPEGYDVTVDEQGVVSVKAPSGVEPGDTAEITVTVNEDTQVALKVTVREVSEDAPESTEETPVEESVVDDSVTLDRETYNELRSAAQHGWKAMEQEKENKLADEVDTWIGEGRISASLRSKAVAAMKRDAAAARDIYGSNPVGTIPRMELGSGRDDEDFSSLEGKSTGLIGRPKL